MWPHAATNACAEKSGLRGSFLTFNGSKVKCTEKSGLRGSQMIYKSVFDHLNCPFLKLSDIQWVKGQIAANIGKETCLFKFFYAYIIFDMYM